MTRELTVETALRELETRHCQGRYFDDRDIARVLRAALSEPVALSTGNMGYEPDGPVGMALSWLKAALKCEQFVWDVDQHEYATQTLRDAEIRLAASAPALQAGQGEPAAYRYKDTRGHWRYVGAPLTMGWAVPGNLSFEPLYSATSESPRMPEAIAWQKRHPESTEGQWETCSYGDYIFWDKRPGWETRALYAAPPPTHERAAPAPEPADLAAIRHTLMTGLAHNAAIAALDRIESKEAGISASKGRPK